MVYSAAGGLQAVTRTHVLQFVLLVAGVAGLVAAGPFLGAFLGTGPLLSLLLASGIVMVYSAVGGLQAVARTHVVQFVLLVAGAAGMVAALASRTTWGAVRAAAAGSGRAAYFDVFSGAERNLLIALSFVLAWTISPIAWQRMQAARSEAASRGGTFAAAVLLGLFYAGIVAAGMLFLPLFPDGGSGVPLVTRFVGREAGSFLGGLLFVTVLAAIFSTMDAALNAGAMTLTTEILGERAGPGAGRRPLLLARMATSALALGALLIAARLGDILKTLGLASTIMAEGLLVPGVAALFLKKRAPLAGLLGLTLGGGYAVVSFLGESGLPILSVPPWPRSLPLGVAHGAAGFAAGLLLERSRGRRSSQDGPQA
jgi:SSS family solute:Na+ symporter